jgi:putative spermidine/putrescine transport system substrate-binding protein
MRSRKLILLITTIALLATACTSSGDEEGADLPTEIGEGEGSVVIVSWAGYIERGDTDPAYDWVTQF